MLDFTSSLYLGFEHASSTLPGWMRLTLGKPAALERLAGVQVIEDALAELTGCEQVVLGSSTLHLFCDLFEILAKQKVEIWIDEATYPIARWASDRASAVGAPVRMFAHHDAAALQKAVSNVGVARPVIVTDGYSPLRGTHAPIAVYARCAAARNGIVIVDDTQALGIFGHGAGPLSPYGKGGGGSLHHCNLRDGKVVVVSSLAKAFGVPVAMLGGNEEFVREFRKNSSTLVHCSPPSQAVIAAAHRALDMNSSFGDELRYRLLERVARFRQRLSALLAVNSLFPVQPLRVPLRTNVRAIHQELLASGVRTVLHRESKDGPARISFVLTTLHRLREIDCALQILGELMQQPFTPKGRQAFVFT